MTDPPRTRFRLSTEPDLLDTAARPDDASVRRQCAQLREHAIWFCQLRWLVVVILAAAGLAARIPAVQEAFELAAPPSWPLAAAAILTACNLLYCALLTEQVDHSLRFPVRLQLWLQIVVDLVVLTAVVHFLGGMRSAAPFMYLFHIILCCMFFPQWQSLAVTFISALLFSGCVALESAGWLRPCSAPTLALSPAAPGVLLTLPILAIWVVIWALASRLAGTLRESERSLAAVNEQLKASSEERARHMLQTAHQLKAPFAAIHANTQLLLGGYCGELTDKAASVVEKMAIRCALLSNQITEMLQLANLRSKGQAAHQPRRQPLRDLIESCIARVEPAATLRNIRFHAELQEVEIQAVEDHIRMLVDNLLTNAVNYSRDGGRIDVRCRPLNDKQAEVTIGDHGIGIPADKLSSIFDDYYRTEEAARHNKASTGLGLAIVRDVSRLSGVLVEVESAVGQGTEFRLAVPRVVSRTAN